MSRKLKQISIGLSILITTCAIFFGIRYIETQKKLENIEAFWDDAGEALEDYDIEALAIRYDSKVIRAHIPLTEERIFEIGNALTVAAKANNLDDYEIKVKSIEEGAPIEN